MHFENSRRQFLTPKLLSKKTMSNATFHNFRNAKLLATMGPIMSTLELLSINISGGNAPAKSCAVTPPYVWTVGCSNCAVGLFKNTKTNKIAHIATGRHFCTTPPAGIVILFCKVLLLNRIYLRPKGAP